MSEQHTPSLGATPPDGAGRDCVHVAVMPMVAEALLEPGEVVVLTEKGTATLPGRDAGHDKIGVVDPFRGDFVGKGERFWLFLFPGTINGLRHAWSHPAFDDEAPPLPVSKGNDIQDEPDDSDDEPYSCSC